LDDEVRFAPRLLLHVLSGTFRGHERRTQQPLEVAVFGSLGGELLEAARKLGALAPHVFVAIRDLREELVDLGPAVAAEPGATESDVSYLVWCGCHVTFLPDRAKQLDEAAC
jgi:hypothetical protein